MSSVALTAVVAGLIGLIIGSFLAAVSVRLPREMDIVRGRSRCMSCERPIPPWRLVPVLSWVLLRGRCGDCGASISRRYPLIELAGGAVGVWAALNGGPWWMIAATAVLGWQLLLIALIDGENFWLPDVLTWPLAATGVAAGFVIAPSAGVERAIGLVVGFASLWLIGWLYRAIRKRDGLGGGDPFLFAGAGAWVGWTGLPSVMLWASAAGLSIVAALLVARRTVRGDDRLPFGVFLAAGIWLTWLYGPLGVSVL